MSTFIAKLHGSNKEAQKQQKRDSDMESKVGAMHDYVKLEIVVDMVHSRMIINVFPVFHSIASTVRYSSKLCATRGLWGTWMNSALFGINRWCWNDQRTL